MRSNPSDLERQVDLLAYNLPLLTDLPTWSDHTVSTKRKIVDAGLALTLRGLELGLGTWDDDLFGVQWVGEALARQKKLAVEGLNRVFTLYFDHGPAIAWCANPTDPPDRVAVESAIDRWAAKNGLHWWCNDWLVNLHNPVEDASRTRGVIFMRKGEDLPPRGPFDPKLRTEFERFVAELIH